MWERGKGRRRRTIITINKTLKRKKICLAIMETNLDPLIRIVELGAKP